MLLHLSAGSLPVVPRRAARSACCRLRPAAAAVHVSATAAGSLSQSEKVKELLVHSLLLHGGGAPVRMNYIGSNSSYARFRSALKQLDPLRRLKLFITSFPDTFKIEELNGDSMAHAVSLVESTATLAAAEPSVAKKAEAAHGLSSPREVVKELLFRTLLAHGGGTAGARWFETASLQQARIPARGTASAPPSPPAAGSPQPAARKLAATQTPKAAAIAAPPPPQTMADVRDAFDLLLSRCSHHPLASKSVAALRAESSLVTLAEEEPTELRLWALDVELVGCESGDEVVSVALVRCYWHSDFNFTMFECMHEVVKPTSTVLDWRSAITGLDETCFDSPLCNGRTVAEVSAEICSLVSPSDILLGHSVYGDLWSLDIFHENVLDTAMLPLTLIGSAFSDAISSADVINGKRSASLKATVGALLGPSAGDCCQPPGEAHCPVMDAKWAAEAAIRAAQLLQAKERAGRPSIPDPLGGWARSTPRSAAQAAYCSDLDCATQPYIVAVGPSGTGKTLLAIEAGVEALLSGAARRLVITRPAVAADEELGFLPGAAEDKLAPYLRPVFDFLADVWGADAMAQLQRDRIIQVVPLGFMRGLTFKGAFIIADEMQNCSPAQMLMLLTRLGDRSRMVLTGDVRQSDRGPGTVSGLDDLLAKLRRGGAAAAPRSVFDLHELDDGSVQRHRAVRTVLQLYDQQA